MSSESTPPADQGRKKDKGRIQQTSKCLNEKKRREQESRYMEELAELISSTLNDFKSYPMLKPDKCAILKETVSQIRHIKDEDTGGEGSGSSGSGSGGGGGGSGGVSGIAAATTTNNGCCVSGGGSDVVQQSLVSSSKPSPNILASDVIGPLLLEALDGFLFMVSGDGRLEFVSENVTQYLRYTQDDLVGKNIFSIIDQADHTTFRKCLEPILARSSTLQSSDAQGNRSLTFECNMIIKTNDDDIEDASISSLQSSRTERMQILAILQQYPHDREADTSSLDGDFQSFLACIARRIGFAEKTVTVLGLEQFTTKQDLNGRILDCDTSATMQGEALCREFVDKNILDFCHSNDKERLKKHHEEVLKMGSNTSGIYRFRMQNRFVFIQTKSKLFKNPTTNHPEFIMSTHSIVRDCEGPTELKGSLPNSLMQAIIGGQSSAGNNRDVQRGCHSSHLARVSSVSSLNQLLTSDNDLPSDMLSLNDLMDIMSSNQMPEDSSGLGAMNGATGFNQLSDALSLPRSSSSWGAPFRGSDELQLQLGNSMMFGGQSRRGLKRRATSPASAAAMRSPGASQRSPGTIYHSSPASKRSSLMTPSPLASFGTQQSYGASNKSSPYRFQDEADLSALLDSVQDEGLCLDDHLSENVRPLRNVTSRPTSQGSGFPLDWDAVSPPAMPPLQALQQLQVNSISTFKDDIHVFHRSQRRAKRDQNGNGSANGTSCSPGASVAQQGHMSRSSRPFQDLRLRELLINDDDSESQSGLTPSISASDTKKRDVKILPGSTNAKRAPLSGDPETTKSPQWIMNPSPQQPQSTTFVDDHPDSSSNKDMSNNERQSPSTRNKILKELLSQEDDDDDDNEPDPGSTVSFGAGRQMPQSNVSVLRVLAKLDRAGQSQPQPVVSSLPDTSASPRDQERELEPTSNSGSGSSNNLLKKLLNSTDDICKGDGKTPKQTELLQKLLSENSDDVSDSNTAPVVESTSTVEMELENKATSSSSFSSSSSDTSPVVAEEKSQFSRLNDPKGEKLKLMLKSYWEADGNSKPRAVSSSALFKKPKVSVDEAAADSTDFEAEMSLPPSSTSVVGAMSLNQGVIGGLGGSNGNNKLLLQLLQGSQPTMVPVLNTGSISAVATVTPQAIMAKKAEVVTSGVRQIDSRSSKDHSLSDSDILGMENTMKATSSSSSMAAASPAVGRQTDISWSLGKTKPVESQQARQSQPQTPMSSQPSVMDKLNRETCDETDLNSLPDCLSGNNFLDSLINNADIEKILDEVTSDGPTDGLGGMDDSTILSHIEQYIMSSSMSLTEVDSLLQIGGEEKSLFLDLSEEVAIGAIQQQLMSMETTSTNMPLKPGTSSSSSVEPQFVPLPDKNLMTNTVGRLPNMDSNVLGNKASMISDLMKEFQMLESQDGSLPTGHLALPQQQQQQQKQSGQNRNVMNQLQKILNSRNQEKSVPPQRPVLALNNSPNVRLLGQNVQNTSSLKSPMTPQSKAGFALMDTTSNDAGLVANLSEMMNVTHAPNVVAPSSSFRCGGSIQPRLMSQSSTEGNAVQVHSGSDLQRALSSNQQWNQRGVSIMAGGALVQQANQRATGSRPGTAVTPSMDDIMNSSLTLPGNNHMDNSSNSVIEDLLASVLPSPSPKLNLQQQLQMRLMQNHQDPDRKKQQLQQQQLQQQQLQQQQQQQPQQGTVLGDMLSSDQIPGTVQVNRFRDPLSGRGGLKLSNANHLQSPLHSSPKNSAVGPVMSPSIGSLSNDMMSPMLDTGNGLLSPSLGGHMTDGSPFSSGMVSPSVGVNNNFPASGNGHKTPSSYSFTDAQVDVKGSPFGGLSLDRQSSRNGNLMTSVMSGVLQGQGKSDVGMPLTPKVSGTSKDTKQALKLSIQSRTSGGQLVRQQQQQQQQRSPGSAGITSSTKADRLSQYYLPTGNEMVEGSDDCSGMIDCLSPVSDNYAGIQHDGSSSGPMSADNLLGLTTARLQQQRDMALLSQQQQQQQFQRQASLPDQRLLASKKLLEVQGLSSKQMTHGISQQNLQQQLLQQVGDSDAQLQLASLMQTQEMSPVNQSQSMHLMGYRQQQQQQMREMTTSKQQMTVNQFQHLGQMQQPGQHQQLAIIQQSGQHLPLGMMQQVGQHQQQQQQQQVSLQQLGQHQQLGMNQQSEQMTVMQQSQGQHQQMTVIQQQQQQQQLGGLEQANQNQQAGMIRLQQLQRMRQMRSSIPEMQQLQQQQQQQQLGVPNQQRLLSQGMASQGTNQWGGGGGGGGGMQQSLPMSPAQPEPVLMRSVQRMDSQNMAQTSAEFGCKAELLQQLISGKQQVMGSTANCQDNSRSSALQSGGSTVQDTSGIGIYLQSQMQVMNNGTSQNNNLQLMMQGSSSQPHFVQQQQLQELASNGLNGNAMNDDVRRKREEPFAYPNVNDIIRRARDEGRTPTEDFFRAGLQKLINEQVHKDSATIRMRMGSMAPPPSANTTRRTNSGFLGNVSMQDSGASGLESAPGDGLTSPLLQSPSLGGPLQSPLGTPNGTPRPRTGTVLLEKLLSEESG